MGVESARNQSHPVTTSLYLHRCPMILLSTLTQKTLNVMVNGRNPPSTLPLSPTLSWGRCCGTVG